MSNRRLPSLMLVLLLSALPARFAHAAEPTLGDVIAAQGNVALQQIRNDAARNLPGRVRAQIALPQRALGNYADERDIALDPRSLYVNADAVRFANET
ncbi:MAG TPA: hypothetical protein VGE51_04305 [Fontimonas sp.]